jgi:hypothetical protein
LPIYNQEYIDLLLAKIKESDAARNGNSKITVIMESYQNEEPRKMA